MGKSLVSTFIVEKRLDFEGVLKIIWVLGSLKTEVLRAMAITTISCLIPSPPPPPRKRQP